ncbi:hypothetical protein M9H77_09198 [Catharanthus roseus]|uniref:Uncharacterized protein n=1 Tax=Catharanthus roseus TaxID=4058 RepID=A0ACC0BZV9_CATRO|nr:hypothetical protein M9H77_09198 [Catharanthus roseus]
MSISYLVANDPEIPVSNLIQQVQILFQTSCTYKRAWYARKFAIERIEMKSREHKVTTYNPREGIYMVKSPIRCVEKMGQEQILMCQRYIRNKRTEELTRRIFIRS